MMNELVSVIIPTYGRSDCLERAIKSVLMQTYSNIEVIVVDDNGLRTEQQKKTELILHSYRNQTNIRYIPHEINKGGCAARNTGVKYSKGKYVAFLDDDDWYLPKYVQNMVKVMREEDTRSVYMPYAYCDINNKVICPKKETINHRLSGRIFNQVLAGKCSISIFFIAERTLMKEIGYFDEELKGFQDADVWFKITKKERVSVMLEPLAVYTRDDRDRITKNPQKRYRDFVVFCNKWLPLLTYDEKKIFDNFCKYHEYHIKREIFEKKRCAVVQEKYTKEEYEFLINNAPRKAVKLRVWMIRWGGQYGLLIYEWGRRILKKEKYGYLKR